MATYRVKRRCKNFAITFGLGNLANAAGITNAATTMTTAQRVGEAAKGVAKLGATGYGVMAITGNLGDNSTT